MTQQVTSDVERRPDRDQVTVELQISSCLLGVLSFAASMGLL